MEPNYGVMHKRLSLIYFMLVINWLPLPQRVIRAVAALSGAAVFIGTKKNEEKDLS